ncbi:MAG TPA: permease prefix domain 1-containing protein, partial [Acidimicrobiales bacterium]|nr:permease prefix domain 1-containing protein [Acidimicrobiales bacterium]
MEALESQIAEWRGFVAQRPAVDDRDVEELEAHLREQIADLDAAGLAADEAFLVAVKRMGGLDSLSREFAREHSGRLWKQLVLSGGGEQEQSDSRWPEALAFALAAALTVQFARLASGFPGEESLWLLRNASLLVVPFLAGYFARRRRLPLRQCLLTAAPFVVAAVVVNLYPYREGASTELLVAAHLPVALWFVVAYPYMGGVVRSHERRMDFVRFTGECFIYYALIALGGGVLMGLTALILEPTGPGNGERVIEWV